MLAVGLSLLLSTASPPSSLASPPPSSSSSPPPSLSTVKIEKGLGPALRPIAAVFAELPGVVVTATDEGFLAVRSANDHDGSTPIHVEVFGGVICPAPPPKDILDGEPGVIWAQYDVRYRRIDPFTGARRAEQRLLGESRRLQMTKEAFWAAPSTWEQLREVRDDIVFPGRNDTLRALITPAFAGRAEVVDATADEVAKSPAGEVFVVLVDGRRLVMDGAITCTSGGQGAVLNLVVRARDLVNMRRGLTHSETFFASLYPCDTAISHTREKIQMSLRAAAPKLVSLP